MKNILVATDLSERSDRALQRAVALTDELGAKLTLIHVIDEEYPSIIENSVRAKTESLIEEKVKAYANRESDAIARKVSSGVAATEILREAEESAADLLVLGTHRTLSLADLFFGTTVERVIRLGNDPVLVARNPVRGAYRRVLVAVDFSVYSRRAVEFALQFVPKGDFSLLHAIDLPFTSFAVGKKALERASLKHQRQMEAMVDEEMRAFLATLDPNAVKLKKVIREGAPRDVIADQVRQLKPDLLVVGTHGRTGLSHAFLGSVAQDILCNPPCDVLAVKAW